MSDSGNGRVGENFNGGIFDGYREDVEYPGDQSLSQALDAAEHGTSMESLLPSEDREALAIGRSVLTVAKAFGGLLRVMSAAGNEAVRDVNRHGLRGAVAQSLRRAALNIEPRPPAESFVHPSAGDFVRPDIAPTTGMPIDDYDPGTFNPAVDMSDESLRQMEDVMLRDMEERIRAVRMARPMPKRQKQPRPNFRPAFLGPWSAQIGPTPADEAMIAAITAPRPDAEMLDARIEPWAARREDEDDDDDGLGDADGPGLGSSAEELLDEESAERDELRR